MNQWMKTELEEYMAADMCFEGWWKGLSSSINLSMLQPANTWSSIFKEEELTFISSYDLVV